MQWLKIPDHCFSGKGRVNLQTMQSPKLGISHRRQDSLFRAEKLRRSHFCFAIQNNALSLHAYSHRSGRPSGLEITRIENLTYAGSESAGGEKPCRVARNSQSVGHQESHEKETRIDCRDCRNGRLCREFLCGYCATAGARGCGDPRTPSEIAPGPPSAPSEGCGARC